MSFACAFSSHLRQVSLCKFVCVYISSALMISILSVWGGNAYKKDIIITNTERAEDNVLIPHFLIEEYNYVS